MKPVSIPLLELFTTTISLRVDEMLRRELEMQLSEKLIFWTDGMTVLRYVKNESRWFHTLIANRNGMIRDGSTPDQWRHVNGDSNPGDYASRRLPVEALLTSKWWLMEPEFLCKPDHQGPMGSEVLLDIKNDDPEAESF